MRDPQRLDGVLKEIKKSWEKNPEYRFGQWFFNTVINEIGDPFFIEDDELLTILKSEKIYKKRN
jgi:hypothetical protein